MAGRVNTKFVFALSGVLAALIMGLAGFWYVFVYKDADELIRRGDMMRSDGQLEEAVEYYEKAIGRRPNDPQLLQKYILTLQTMEVDNRTDAQQAIGKIHAATRMIADLRPDDPLSAEQYYQTVYQFAREFNDVSWYNTLYQIATTRLQSRPQDTLARKFRGIAQVHRLAADMPRQDQLAALEDLEAAREQMPQDADVLHHIARWKLFEADRLDRPDGDPAQAAKLREEAVQISQQMLDQQPDGLDRQLYHLTVLLAPGVNQTQAAKPLLEQVEARLLDDPQPRLAVLNATEMLLRADSASTGASPEATQPTTGMARAQRLLEAAIEHDPQNVSYLHMLGRLLAMQGQHEAAITCFEHVRSASARATPSRFLLASQIQIDATFQMANLLLGGLSQVESEEARDQQLSQVESLIEDIRTDLQGQSPLVMLLEGKVSLLRGRLGEAALKFDRAAQQLHGSSGAESLLLASRTYRQMGDWGEAAKRLETLLDAQPALTGVRSELVEIYLRGGMVAEAERHLAALRIASPDDPQVKLLEAQMLGLRGQVDQAIAIYESLDAERYPQIIRPLVTLYQLADRQDDALALLGRRLQANPADASALLLWASVNPDQTAVAQAIVRAREAGADERLLALLEKGPQLSQEEIGQYMDRLVEEQEDPLERALMRFEIFSRRGQLQEAAAALDEAAGIQPDHPRVIEMQFNLALSQQRWEDAQRLAQRAGQMNLDLAQGAFFQGRLAAARGQGREAIAHYRRGLEARPVFSEGWRQFGALLAQNNQLVEAAGAFRRAIEQRPNDTQALAGLAQVQLAQGQHQEALELYRRALGYNPRDISLLRNYLVALENFGDVEEALRLRRQIAEQAPQDLNNRRALAILLAREGQTQEAQQTVEKLIAEEGRDRDNMMTLATVQRFSGQAQAGEQTLETYLADLGSQAQAQDHVALAQYRLSIGDTDGALEAYQQGMRIEDPETRPVTRELADLLFEQRALDQAITLYQQLHEQFPDDLRVTLRLAESLILAQRYDESEPLLSPLKPSAQVHALRAMMALGRGDRQRARLLFNQALELEPRNPVILLERARLNANDPDPAWTQAAERDLREILSFKPDAHEARLLLAQLLLDRQETDEAARELRSVLSLAPQHIPARLMLLDLYVSRQDWTSAQSLLTEAANLYPQADAWPRLLAQVAAQQGQTEKAQQHWRHVLDLAPTPQNVGDFAVYLLKIGKPDQVLELLREHAQVTESYVSLQALRGRALAATNQREQAQRVFAVALGRCQSLGEVGMLAAQMKEALGLPDTISALEVAQSPAPLWRQIVLAQLEVADHKYDQALKRLEASEAQIPADEAAVRAMVQGIRANALQGQGRYQEAQQLYEQLLEAHPQDVQTLNNLAYLLADNLNDASRALPLAQRAADLAPRSAQVLDTLGWAQYKAGQVENALQTLQQALTLEPLAPVYLHLSIIYADLQNTDEARTSLKEAIRLAENSNDQEVLSRAQELLAQLGTP